MLIKTVMATVVSFNPTRGNKIFFTQHSTSRNLGGAGEQYLNTGFLLPTVLYAG